MIAAGLCLVTAALIASAACADRPDPRRTNFEIVGDHATARYDPATGKLTKVDVDQNKNGRHDTFSYWNGAQVIRIELDRDEDGRIDRWEYYDGRQQVIRLGSSSRDDQVVDTWTYPDSGGFLAKVETDTDRDGVVDRREFFATRAGATNGRVLRLAELDINRAGVPKWRLFYRPDGSLDHTERHR